MQYTLELNLQRMVMLEIAVSLWERPHIKYQVIGFFLGEDRYKSDSRYDVENEDRWTNITKKVLNQLEPEILPKILDSELIYVVRKVGAKIYDWYEYIMLKAKYIYCFYSYQITYWTPYGGIDKVKILKSFCLKRSSSSHYTMGMSTDGLFRLSCSYVMEEIISNLWQQIPKDSKEISYNRENKQRLYSKYESHLIAYWQFYLDGELHYLIQYLIEVSHDRVGRKLYDHSHSVEENMFRLSVSQGYELATRYFWNKLNEEQQERNLITAACMAIKEYGEEKCKREGYIEICTFLVNQIPEDRMEKLLEKEVTTKFVMMFLSIWPWQEFFIPTLERVWGYIDNVGYGNILHKIVCKISKDYKFGMLENSKYQRILHETWNKIPVNSKQTIPQNYCSDIMFMLFDIWDISSIKLIVNDQDMVQRRLELIDMGYKKYKDLIREDKYEVLDQFIQEILVSEEEKMSFRQKIDIWDYFIVGDYSPTKIESQYHKFVVKGECRDRYDLADKLLDWQSSSIAERKELKNKIDYTKICYYFIVAEKYDLADKFLVWRFESAEEIKNCKNSFKDEFLCDYIYKLWATYKAYGMEIVRRKSSDVLNWFIDSEEEIALFKKEKLVNEEFNKTLFNFFIEHSNFKMIEYFLEWCLLPQETIKQLKQVIVDRIILQKFTNYDDIKQQLFAYDFLFYIQKFVQWAFDTEEKREEFMKKFSLSDDEI